MDYSELINIAKKAQNMAYAPYSKINVGAALLSKNGKVFLGCNVENSSFGATVCAERVAFLKAVSEGEKDFIAIAITSSLDGLTYPCGICRQVIVEFAPDVDVVLLSEPGNLKILKIYELYPNAFLHPNICEKEQN